MLSWFSENLPPLLAASDYWLERYQTFLVGLVAIVVAWKQTKIVERQGEIMTKQSDTEKAIAQLALDQFFKEIHPVIHTLFWVQRGSWPRIISGFDKSRSVDVDKIGSSAVVAYPEAALQIVRLSEAWNELLIAVNTYKDAPWEDDPVVVVGRNAVSQGLLESAPPSGLPEGEMAVIIRSKAAVEDFTEAAAACKNLFSPKIPELDRGRLEWPIHNKHRFA